MKQIKNLAWMSAIALAGTMTFAACSSDDDKVENINPTYDGKSVKTQFAINIPRAAQTRQTAEITQNNSNFRGIDNILLYSVKDDFEEEFLNPISLIEDEKDITSLAQESRKVYSDVTIPIGTKHFLFYGKANLNSEASKAKTGSLNFTATSSTREYSDINASLVNIYPSTLSYSALTDILNNIVQAKTNDTKIWKDADNRVFYNTCNDFTKLNAGSAQSIKAAVKRLYNKLKELELNEDEDNDKIRDAIVKAIEDEDAFKIAENTFDYNIDSDIITNFPENLGLPEGAARLTYNESRNEFAYSPSTTIGSLNSINTTSICYPAELYYRAKTELYASTSDNVTWPTSLENWKKPSSWTNWTSSVAADTRTIALKENINYAVASLATVVKIASEKSYLEDNAVSAGGENSARQIPVSNNSYDASFRLTGVLVGGQPSQVDGEFAPVSNATFTNTVYDNQMNGIIINETTGERNNYIDVTANNAQANYTMLLDNLVPGEDTDQNKVHIALELVNNSGEEFYGQGGIVPVGGKFYLVGMLDPAADDRTVSEPESSGLTRVFAQDYTTTANFTISSLKNAYVTIPDLRSTKLQLGLSVDLSWEAGLTFDVTID